MPAALTRRPTLTEVLPAGRDGKPGAIRFTPGQRAGTGLVCVQVGRVPCEYLVVELPTDWDGRAVRLAKVEGSPGTDRDAESYDVFASRDGRSCRCDCRGFERHGRCKHVETLRALVANGWLDAELSDPGADMGDTEPPLDQDEPSWVAEEEARQAAAEAADQRAAERDAAGEQLPVYEGEYPF